MREIFLFCLARFALNAPYCVDAQQRRRVYESILCDEMKMYVALYERYFRIEAKCCWAVDE